MISLVSIFFNVKDVIFVYSVVIKSMVLLKQNFIKTISLSDEVSFFLNSI